jgi:predicted Zn-ribbon and HTH transcriptional regulator
MQDAPAVEEVQTLFLNFYECSECGTKWTDEWDCMCNDRCPKCSCEIEPYDTVEIYDHRQ